MLVRAAFGALFRGGLWSVLVVLAFVVAGTACAAPGMFAEAARNAAFQAARDAVPATARQDDAALVRVTGSRSPRSAGQQRLLTELRTIPHLSEPRLDGGSAGRELSWSKPWSSTVTAGSRQAKARLYAVTDPAAELVVTDASGPPGGVWLPQPLGFRAGETVTIAVADKRATATVTGLYAVGPDGRRPADLPGSLLWALRDRDLPFDSRTTSVKAHLIIGDVPTTERLAVQVHDQILWAAESTLDPDATLTEARETGRGVAELRRRVAAQGFDGGQDAVTVPLGAEPERVNTAASLRQRDVHVAAARARGYQVAVAAYLALLAVLTLCVHAQRTAAARRASDLMLIRVGLGRARALRVRLLELVLLAAVATTAAIAGVAVLLPFGTRLLDDEPARLPPLHFALTGPALLITATVGAGAVVLAALFTTSRSAEEASYRDDG
ncbi:hypothetical protein [Paractinoplanes brasiliensis]|uniref:FtsX-like permease family protein n=1 Tax=Paractinoplanes brasiliensis TaxID=52695 RepID=A0A4R6J9X0_9ACTN|nr:hypothetical protein [Actinoplanes brasiliensis]TDO32463.1 hypothetical protein C8E87_7924 [Actinoplanes brasiliensis]GID27664.1 hypothetical protein Abr02nite_26470 [Actinoplanes brasiliensis]